MISIRHHDTVKPDKLGLTIKYGWVDRSMVKRRSGFSLSFTWVWYDVEHRRIVKKYVRLRSYMNPVIVTESHDFSVIHSFMEANELVPVSRQEWEELRDNRRHIHLVSDSVHCFSGGNLVHDLDQPGTWMALLRRREE